ncbi:MAG TPA: DUF308 domain-containing protein [Terracidiphilus sp.]|jgi:uncharacterized membrane protein HdeD (DUF308 family)
MSSFVSVRDSSTGWSIFFGILLVVAGFASIALPFVAGIAASIFFGWLILLAGVAHLVYAWFERGAGAVIWQILIGLVYIGAAIAMFILPVTAVVTLTLVLGWYIAIEGIFELVLFSRLRRVPGAGWFLFDGIVSLLLAGLIVFRWPSSSFWVLGTLVGISLLFSGIARLTVSTARRRIVIAA